MRKVLIASVVAVVLFAVGAFAASFLVNSEDVASGTDDVVACAEEVDVDFTTEYDAAAADWEVTGAVVTFFDDGPTEDCDGFDATLAVETTLVSPTSTVVATETAPVVVAAGSATFDLSGEGIFVRDVTGASVLVDGETLTAEPPA